MVRALATSPALWPLALLGACIIPDRDIRIESGLDNENAVRIVQRAPRVAEMDDLCNLDPSDDPQPAYCPQVRRTRPSGLIMAPEGGDFCVCPRASGNQPGSDRRAIASFEIYAEDADGAVEGRADTLYGVALLDADATDDEPYNAVAYGKYWQPGRAGEPVEEAEDLEGDRTAPPSGRPAAGLSVFQLDDSTGIREIDLCNEAGRPVSAGLHTLRFMVTDRPFFRPRALDLDGGFAVDENGDPAYGNEQPGVPDLASGATYATIDFGFECRDASDPEADCRCDGDDE